MVDGGGRGGRDTSKSRKGRFVDTVFLYTICFIS